MILSLLGALGAILQHLLPAGIDLIKDYMDKSQERFLIQLEIEKLKYSLYQTQTIAESNVSQTQIQADNSPNESIWVSNFKAIIRPILAIWMMIMYTWAKIHGIQFTDYDEALMGYMVTSYFYGRMLFNLKR